MSEVSGPTDSVFPLRAAAIDIGSNAMRFVAVEFLDPTRWNVLEQVRSPVRLGRGAFAARRLADDAIEAAVQTLAGYARLLETRDIAHYRAVATSAVRESRNQDVFLSRAAAEAGIEVEPITGTEEARLVHLAVAGRIDMMRGRWLLADLGGGSVEVSLVDSETIHWSVSHDMGSVRMLEELSMAGDDTRHFQRRLEEYTATLRLPRRSRVKGFAATGGNIEALARLADAPVDARGVSVLRLRALHAIIDRLGGMTAEERVRDLDLREDRADVILPAAMVYERLCMMAGFDEIHVPGVGVKEGVLLDLADDLSQHGRHGVRQDQQVYHSAVALGRRYRFDQPHARHVTKLALILFDELHSLHGLDGADRRLLMAAAILHDIGGFIGYRKHHKHSLYLISQAELPGVSTADMRIVANVGRYHRKSEPAQHHEEFMALGERARDRVTRLAALLRIADALDREHAQNVTRLTATDDGETVTLTVQGRGDMLLEQWAVEKKCGLFEKVFSRSIRVLAGSGA